LKVGTLDWAWTVPVQGDKPSLNGVVKDT